MMNPDDGDISHLWQRHLMAAVRDNLSAASVQALPSGARSLDNDADEHRTGKEMQVGQVWDEQMDSVVDALQELTIQSPTTNTTDARSPETGWFVDSREGYTETALSSPQNSSWSRTILPPHKTKQQHKRLALHDELFEVPRHDASKGKGKGLAIFDNEPSPTRLSSQPTSSVPTWYTEDHLRVPITDDSYESYYGDFNPYAYANARDIPPDPPTVTARPRSSQEWTWGGGNINVPPEEVHVLILTWAKQDARRDDGQLLSPSLDMETATVRACFKRRGYRVQCRHVPEDYPTAAVETMLNKFLDKSTDKSLLVVYYHGYGSMDEDGRMVFSSGSPNGSSFFWDDVRDPIMQAPGDVLLIFDCCPIPGARGEGEMLVEAGMVSSSSSTKQLLGICAPSNSVYGERRTTGMMTEALCRTLDGDKFRDKQISVQCLCSHMKEDLKAKGTELASKVFVTQMGGGQLLDICLPWFTCRD
ncbi:hypothetical protein B0H66DRAFT_533887 [Apodospora peruviana]|uniref:Peptidase C14 caspase domain-containing protein n=1 Tax=Apodospora peruviana TaxID=516989 RepID=A0AAE0I6J7_9PEZI|nr:hypothetical protein B0H66DRAFT_533887 [Apodospora peruviana]